MWDISSKVPTARSAKARAVILVAPAAIEAIRMGTAPKGDPIAVARVAAIQAAKITPTILPYCHPLALEHTGVEFEVLDDRIIVTTLIKAQYKTGVEMEALTAASVAALTLWDMLKMIDPALKIVEVSLLEKLGGKSDFHGAGP